MRMGVWDPKFSDVFVNAKDMNFLPIRDKILLRIKIL